jgi:recombination protein RecA
LAKNAQAKGLLCGYIDTENRVDLDYWKFLGVSIDDILVCRPQGATGEEVLQLALDLMEEGVQFLGLDSIASLVPKAVLEGDMSDKTYAGASGIMSTFSQKLTGSGIIQKNYVSLVGINQIRDIIGSYVGGTRTTGGHFWKHACSCRLHITRGKLFDENYKELAASTQDETAGYQMNVKMEKNQFSMNDRRFALCTYKYKVGIDVIKDAITVADIYGIIARHGAWYHLIDPDTGELIAVDGEEFKCNGMAKLYEAVSTNEAVKSWLFDTLDGMISSEYNAINALPEE